MPNVKISSLPSAASLSGAEIVPLVQSGATVRSTVSQLRGDASNPYDPLNLAQYAGVSDCTAALQAAINTCFGPPEDPHAKDTPELNQPFILPPGIFNISSALVFPPIHGGTIRGAQRFATQIQNTSGGGCFKTSGFEYSYFGNMLLETTVGGTEPLFDLDWDNSDGPALQSNRFNEVYFANGTHGVRIGNTGFMGSENLFTECFFHANTVAGISTENFNALQQSVLGCNFDLCDIAILVNFGSVPIIHGTGFQQSGTFDIAVNNSAGDGYSIQGCRSESTNFVFMQQTLSLAHITGCAHHGLSNGVFLNTGASAIVECCQSVAGTVHAQNGIFARSNVFARSDWLTGATPVKQLDNLRLAQQESGTSFNLRPTTNLYPIVETTSNSAVTCTINNDATAFFPTGTEFDIIQYGDGIVTIVPGPSVVIAGTRVTSGDSSGIRIRKSASNIWLTTELPTANIFIVGS